MKPIRNVVFLLIMAGVSSAIVVEDYSVADDGGTGAINVGGITYNQQEIIFHDTADLALVLYDKPFPGFYSLYKGAVPTQKSQRLYAILVGYGYTGTVHNSFLGDYGDQRSGRYRADVDGGLSRLGPRLRKQHGPHGEPLDIAAASV